MTGFPIPILAPFSSGSDDISCKLAGSRLQSYIAADADERIPVNGIFVVVEVPEGLDGKGYPVSERLAVTDTGQGVGQPFPIMFDAVGLVHAPDFDMEEKPADGVEADEEAATPVIAAQGRSEIGVAVIAEVDRDTETEHAVDDEAYGGGQFHGGQGSELETEASSGKETVLEQARCALGDFLFPFVQPRVLSCALVRRG